MSNLEETCPFFIKLFDNKTDNIIVIDDAIPESYQKNIFDIVTNYKYPYYYCHATSIENKNREEYSLTNHKKEVGMFIHRLIEDGQVNSNYAEELLYPFKLFKDKIDKKLEGTKFNIDFDKIIRFQSNFVTEKKRIFYYRTPWHVDTEIPHIAMLYYIVDADGKTVFKNGKSITPKKGRCVIFDGKLQHAHELSKMYRLVLNFNFLIA
jgi:hypothetical protein